MTYYSDGSTDVDYLNRSPTEKEPERLILDSACTLEGLVQGLETATVWAEYGYTNDSRNYWRGIRDTLRVVLGHTRMRPRRTGPGCDNAADVLLVGAPVDFTH